mmetsp:Transcript_25057/g.83311  ORF Transcript_25057/g.83311 Transcript_25057/m.83311 type:complete len:369 (-) Transcript_25057:220-1326(-)
MQHVVPLRREGRVEQRRKRDKDHVARSVDTRLPVADHRPLRGEGLARRSGQSARLEADVQVQKGLAPLQPADALVQLRRQRRRCCLAHQLARRPQVCVRDDRLGRAQRPAALEPHAGAPAAALAKQQLVHVRVEHELAASVLGHAAHEGADDALGAAHREVEADAVAVEVAQHVRHQCGRRVLGRRALQQEADHVEPVADERVGDPLLLQQSRKGRVQLVAAALEHHARERARVLAHRDRRAQVGTHGRRRQLEDRLTQRRDSRHEPLPLLRSVRPAARLELLVKVGRAHRVVQQVALGQIRTPSVVREPLGLLTDDLVDVLERVWRAVRRQPGVQRRPRLEGEALGRPAVSRAAGCVMRFADAHLEA